MHARSAEAQPGDLLSLGRDEWFVHATECRFAGESVSGRALDAQEASVGAVLYAYLIPVAGERLLWFCWTPASP